MLKERIVILIQDFLKYLQISNQTDKHKNEEKQLNKTQPFTWANIKMLALKMGYKLKHLMLQNQPMVLLTHHHYPFLVKTFQSHVRVYLLTQQTVFYPGHFKAF